jgi:phosphatidylserine/phosphatidylglycerophosphate/cardiolipin synthase-like enzyme
MRIINGYDHLHIATKHLIDTCDDTLFLFSFSLCLQYNKRIYKSIKKALKRNVKIYIVISGVNKYENYINHQNCVIISRNIRDINSDRAILLKQMFNLQVGNDYVFVNHLRFCYNGKQLLFGGTNISPRYTGTQFNVIPDHSFTWYDSGLLMKLPDQNEYFFDMYDKIKNHDLSNIKQSLVFKYARLSFSNKNQYEYIVEQIQQSKSSIYIENQYFFSCENYTSNIIGKTLASRINRAIHESTKFHVTIIVNFYNLDECENEQLFINCTAQKSLLELRENVFCDDETFNKYVSIYMPTNESRIVVHSKVFLFDDERMLYTTCNICDRSFYVNGDLEGGLIIENKKYVKKLKKQLYNDFEKSQSLFYKFNFSEIDHAKLCLIEPLYHTTHALASLGDINILECAGMKLPLDNSMF